MCGICGIVTRTTDHDAAALEQAAQQMLRQLAHRGPHGDALSVRGTAAMAVNRLAIRGVEEMQPPLIELSDGILVACNGEIDNHRELRRFLAQCGHEVPFSTDVAVIAPLYLEKGLSFVEHLQGVFALALWDTRRQRLILARDRAGERHLYYNVDGSTIRFASELAALADPAAPLDHEAIAQYLQSGYCPAPHSFLAGHHKVCPGEMIVFEPEETRHVRYWQFPQRPATATTPAPRSFDHVMREAVHRQSEVDVDFGVLLSGGLDSALIAAIARSLRPARTLPAYCIRFAEASYDEGSDAERTAERLGCPFVPVTVSADDVPTTLRELITSTGEPLADPAWIPLAQVTRRASQDVRVVLAGEGADELFGGYPTYLGAQFAGRYAHLPAGLRAGLRHLIERLPPSDRKVTLSFLLKRFISGQELDGLSRHRLWTSHIAPDWLRKLGIEPPVWTNDTAAAGTLLDTVQQFDFTHSLPEALLAKADRGGMLHGVEIRAPFLDSTVIEFAAGLPARARVRGLTTKAFLKDYGRLYLPRSVTHRRKRGLSVPLATWLRGPLHDWAKARLSAPALAEAGVRVETALELLDEHASRRNDHARAIWTLLVLAEWLEWRVQMQASASDRSVSTAPAAAAAITANNLAARAAAS
ncbi:asparagine synthase (glutamine-hydrolyzing) [Dyella sp. A6]|uniref:asparagine synthase (glutamine-hydrolyzing) n=1 Tax=Dyella aluminiiresistens TaxID=3069105 RepID=UPI002E75B318|nr:asparagine synthase (glutamine-hydrolyzing) [Dyella sp. A6]